MTPKSGNGAFVQVYIPLALLLGAGWACSSPVGTGGIQQRISETPASVDFGTLPPGLSEDQRVTVSNVGRNAIAVQTVRIVDDASGVFAVSSAPHMLGIGATAQISVSFTAPSQAGQYSGFLEIDSQAPNAPRMLIALSGRSGSSCDSVTCPPHSTCVATANGTTCACDTGYLMAGTSCVTTDACAHDNGGCDPNAICTDTPGSVICTCKPGYEGNGETGTALVCTPDNPCGMNNGGCDPNSTCTPMGAAVACICNPGFQGNGQTGTSVVCSPINRCLTDNGGCDPHASCTPDGVNVTCACNPGYQGNGQTGTGLVCLPINACSTNNGGCDPSAICVPDHASAICICDQGYQGNGQQGPALVCTAIDLCLRDNGGCGPHATCAQNGTGVICTCDPGYTSNGQTGPQIICTFDDLCATGNGGCDPNATCSSDGISVSCTCNLGFDGNGLTGTMLKCTPGNPCIVNNGGCDPNAQCTEVTSTSVDCKCLPGFIGNGRTGQDLVCTMPPIPPPPPPPPPITPAHPPSMHANHVCDIDGAGFLYCWGANNDGQLGDNSLLDSSVPAAVAGPMGAQWKAVATGDTHTCGILSDGTLFCWGDDTHSALGFGSGPSVMPVSGPLPVPPSLTKWQAISAGSDFTCGIQTDGSLWCWGDNRHGQSGVDLMTSPYTVDAPAMIPAAPGNTWASVSCGTNVACGVQSDHSLWCWGSNADGDLGNSSPTVMDSSVPVPVGTGTFASVSAGSLYSCAIGQSDGSLWCWGTNLLDIFGVGSSTGLDPTPVRIGTGISWTSIAVNVAACGTQADGSLWCTGPNDFGNLGNGNQTSQQSLVPVGQSVSNWSAVAVGTNSVCALAGGHLYCWGSDSVGELGDKATTPDGPSQVAPGTQWKSVALGLVRPGMLQIGPLASEWYVGDWSAGFGVQTNGTLWEWGGYAPFNLIWEHQSYAPYDASQLLSQQPVQVGAGSNWVSVSAGDPTACGLDSSGNLSCVGSTDVGAGNSAPAPVPKSVGLGPWILSSNGYLNGCGIKSNNSLWCWGENQNGQFGDGTIIGAQWPKGIDNSNGSYQTWSTISVGADHACGISGGTLYCWGSNSGGQLGDNTTTDSLTPQPVVGTPWLSVSAGFRHTCGIQMDHTLWCWGQNGAGEVGNGHEMPVITPSQVAGSWSAVATSVTSATTCGIRTSGSLWCWGAIAPVSPAGKVAKAPALLDLDSVWESVATVGNATDATGVANDVTVCAIKQSDNSLWCWGDNSFGERGNGSAWRETPIQVF